MSLVRSRRRGRVPHELDSNSEDEAILMASDQDISSDHYDDSDDDDDDDDDETSEGEDESSENESESEGEADVVSAATSSSIEKGLPPRITSAKATTSTPVTDERKTIEGGTGEKSELTQREKQILQRHEYRRRQAATDDTTSAPDAGPNFEPYAGQFWDHDNRYRQHATLQPAATAVTQAEDVLSISDESPVVQSTTRTTVLQSITGTIQTSQTSSSSTVPPPRRRRHLNFRRVPEELLNNRWTHDGYEELARLEEREQREGRAHKEPLSSAHLKSNHSRSSPAHGEPQQRRHVKRINGASKEWQMFDGNEVTWPAISATEDTIVKETSSDAGNAGGNGDATSVTAAGKESNVGEDNSCHQSHDADETLDWSETAAWSATKTDSLPAPLPAECPSVKPNDDGAGETDDSFSVAASSPEETGRCMPVKQKGNTSVWRNNAPSADTSSVTSAGQKNGYSVKAPQQQPDDDRQVAAQIKGSNSSVSDGDVSWKQSANWSQEVHKGVSTAHDTGSRNRRTKRDGAQDTAIMSKTRQQAQIPRLEQASSRWRKEPLKAKDTLRTPKQPTSESSERSRSASTRQGERHEENGDDWRKAATWATDTVEWPKTPTAKDEWPLEKEKKDVLAPAQQQRQQNKRTTKRGYLSQKNPSSFTSAVPTKGEVQVITTPGPPTVVQQSEERTESVESKSKLPSPPPASSFSYSFDAEPWKPSMAPRDDARGHERFIEEQEEQESDVEIILEADGPGNKGQTEGGAVNPPIVSTTAAGSSADVSTRPHGTPREKQQRDLDGDWRQSERPASRDEDQHPMIHSGHFFYPTQQQMGYMAMSTAQPPPPPPPFAMPMQAVPMPVGSEAGGIAGVGSNLSTGDQENQYLPSSFEANGMVYYSMDPSAVYPYYYYAPMPMLIPPGHIPPNGGEDPDEGWGPVPDQLANEGESDWQTDKQSRNTHQPNQSPAYGGAFYYYPSSQYYT